MSEQESRKYTLYGLKIWKSKKNEGTWVAVKDWVRAQDITDNLYDTIIESEDIPGKPVNKGILTIDTLENINFTKNGGTYDLEIEEVNGKKTVLKGVPVIIRKDIMKLSISKVLRNKKQQPYIIVSYTMPEVDFAKAPNAQKLEEFLKTQGLNKRDEPYNGDIQFTGFANLSEASVQRYAGLENKKQHFEIFIEEKEENYRIQRVGLSVFKAGSLKVDGYISNMNKETSTVEITKLTSYDELRDAKRMNIKFFAKEENRIEEDGKNLKLVFEVKVKNLGTEDIGDEVYFWLNESNVIKISTPQIIIENFGEIAPKANDAAPVANNEPVPAQQAPAEIESSVGMPEEVEISKEDLAAEIKELEGEATGEDEIPF